MPAPKTSIEQRKVGGATFRRALKELDDFLKEDLKAGIELLAEDSPKLYALLQQARRVDEPGYGRSGKAQARRAARQAAKDAEGARLPLPRPLSSARLPQLRGFGNAAEVQPPRPPRAVGAVWFGGCSAGSTVGAVRPVTGLFATFTAYWFHLDCLIAIWYAKRCIGRPLPAGPPPPESAD